MAKSVKIKSEPKGGVPTYFRVILEKTPTSCMRCLSYNGKTFPLGEYGRGRTAPPFHPNCRCWVQILDGYGNVLSERRPADQIVLTRYDHAAEITLKKSYTTGQYHRNVTVPVEAALAQTVSEAKSLQQQTHPIWDRPTRLLWFYEQVKDKAPWDIKRKEQWNSTIADETWPTSAYEQVYFRGQLMTREQLGNFTYGYIGGALGLTRTELIGGSVYAADFPLPMRSGITSYGPSTRLSVKSPNPDFINEVGDWRHILKGLNAYRYQ